MTEIANPRYLDMGLAELLPHDNILAVNRTCSNGTKDKSYINTESIIVLKQT